jgi:hypothetical protein
MGENQQFPCRIGKFSCFQWLAAALWKIAERRVKKPDLNCVTERGAYRTRVAAAGLTAQREAGFKADWREWAGCAV